MDISYFLLGIGEAGGEEKDFLFYTDAHVDQAITE